MQEVITINQIIVQDFIFWAMIYNSWHDLREEVKTEFPA